MQFYNKQIFWFRTKWKKQLASRVKLAYRQFWQLPQTPGGIAFPALYNFPTPQQPSLPGGPAHPFASLLPQNGGLLPFGIFNPTKTVQSDAAATSLSLQQLAQLVGASNPGSLGNLMTANMTSLGLNTAQGNTLTNALSFGKLLGANPNVQSRVQDQFGLGSGTDGPTVTASTANFGTDSSDNVSGLIKAENICNDDDDNMQSNDVNSSNVNLTDGCNDSNVKIGGDVVNKKHDFRCSNATE